MKLIFSYNRSIFFFGRDTSWSVSAVEYGANGGKNARQDDHKFLGKFA
jgi:hypothetical protein